MSYRIEYGSSIPAQYVKKKTYMRLQIMTAVWLLLFTLLVRGFFPAGTEQLKRILLPDAHSVTQTALNDLTEKLRNGQPLHDAFTSFCIYIVEHDTTVSG